jgi:hypothetical protein
MMSRIIRRQILCSNKTAIGCGEKHHLVVAIDVDVYVYLLPPLKVQVSCSIGPSTSSPRREPEPTASAPESNARNKMAETFMIDYFFLLLMMLMIMKNVVLMSMAQNQWIASMSRESRELF